MPRSNGKERTRLPSTLLNSDKHAQRLWKKAHDSAVKTYGDGERAHRVAWAALKHEYMKVGDKWVSKGWKGPSDPQAAQSARDKPKPTAGGKVARTEQEALEKRKEAQREYARNYRRRRKSSTRTMSGTSRKLA
jgi:cation transport regulator ChaB